MSMTRGRLVSAKWQAFVVACGVAAWAVGAPARMLAAPMDSPPSSRATRLKALWGTTPADGLFYMPYGFHNDSSKLETFGLVGGIFKTAFLMTFTNSYGDRTWALGIERDLFQFHRLRFGYGAGLMYGYDGRLAESHGLPFRDTFLFKHAVNPAVGVPLHVDISRHVQFEAFLTPVVSLGGVKIALR